MIYKYLCSKWPEEGCGLINDGKFHPITNVSETPEDNFLFDYTEYFDFLMGAGRELNTSIVHSHPDGNITPSDIDKENSHMHCAPYIIFGKEYNYTMFFPDNWINELLGKEYSFGSNDCLDLCINFYNKLGLKVTRNEEIFKDDWWLENLDYFTESRANSYGLKRVVGEGPLPGDLLVFAINSGSTANHCGVYLGDNKFLHHAVNRLSCREDLGKWRKGIVGVYRHGLFTR